MKVSNYKIPLQIVLVQKYESSLIQLQDKMKSLVEGKKGT